jgi:hypothetical protein
VTSYTRYYQLPHPTATLQPDGTERFNDDARGGRDLQSLAEAVDAQIDRINGLWVAQISKAGLIIKLATDSTGYSANSFNTVFFDTQVKSSGGMTGTQEIDAPLSKPGWYHIHMCMATIPSGAINGTRRALRATVKQTGISGFTDAETYFQEEFENGGQTVNELSFVTFLDSTRFIWADFFHNNTSSTITVKNTVTNASAYRIGP